MCGNLKKARFICMCTKIENTYNKMNKITDKFWEIVVQSEKNGLLFPKKVILMEKRYKIIGSLETKCPNSISH